MIILKKICNILSYKRNMPSCIICLQTLNEIEGFLESMKYKKISLCKKCFNGKYYIQTNQFKNYTMFLKRCVCCDEKSKYIFKVKWSGKYKDLIFCDKCLLDKNRRRR